MLNLFAAPWREKRGLRAESTGDTLCMTCGKMGTRRWRRALPDRNARQQAGKIYLRNWGADPVLVAAGKAHIHGA